MFAVLASLALTAPAPAHPLATVYNLEPAGAAATLEMPALALEPTPAPMLIGGDTPFSWTFVEANYLWRDVDAVDDSLDGWELRASLELFLNLFLQGSYSQLSGDADLDQYALGVGFHLPIGTMFDAFGILSYANDEIDGSGIDEDEGGPMLEVGGRVMLGEKIELNGEIIWADIEDSETGFDVGGRFYITPRISIGANVQMFDEDELFAIGGRFQF